jgi:hypothetical protein
MLWAIWIGIAFSYYGVLIFSTELFLAEDAGEWCPQYLNATIPAVAESTAAAAATTTSGPVNDTLLWSLTTAFNASGNATVLCPTLTNDEYRDAFVQSVAELPVRSKNGGVGGVGVGICVAREHTNLPQGGTGSGRSGRQPLVFFVVGRGQRC